MNASIAKDGSQGHRTCNAMPNIVDFAISLFSSLFLSLSPASGSGVAR